jgi:CheY-like chemotaxis protein
MVLQRSPTSQNLLVVEDEMLLRMLAVDMVEDAGYASVEAVDADEAFAILKSQIRYRVAVHRHTDAW